MYLFIYLSFTIAATSQKGIPEIIRVGKVLLSVTEETFDPFTPSTPTTNNANTRKNPSKTSEQEEAIFKSKTPAVETQQQPNLIEVATTSVRRTLSVTGTASLKKAQVTANISGLELCFEMRNLNGSLYRNKQPFSSASFTTPSEMMGVGEMTSSSTNHTKIGEGMWYCKKKMYY